MRLSRAVSVAVDTARCNPYGMKRKESDDAPTVGPLRKLPAQALHKAPSVESVISFGDGSAAGQRETPLPRAYSAQASNVSCAQPSAASAFVASLADVAILTTDAAKRHPFVPEQECFAGTDGRPCIKIGSSVVPLRDDCDRRPGDAKFNPKVLSLSDSVVKVRLACLGRLETTVPNVLRRQGLSDTMRQYWTVKARYLDSLVLMQIGSSYEAFDMDANVIHR
jgi:hypothetical protein